MSTTTVSEQQRPKWRLVGPGLMAAATGVGAADLVATLIAGSRFGYLLLWAAIVGCVLKIVLVEGVGRYYLATGKTIFQGWRTLGGWTTVYFAIYVVIWGFVYGASAMSSTALPLAALFPDVDLKVFAVASGLLGLALVWLGRYGFFEKIMTVMIGIMFVAVISSAVLAAPDLPAMLGGLVPQLPATPDGMFYVLGLAGGVGGTITLAAYGYWLREKGWTDSRWMRVMRLDNGVAYAITGVFVVATMVMGVELLHAANIAISTGDRGLLDVAGVLEDKYGKPWAYLFLLGFWAASFSSLLGVWHGVSLMFADFVKNWRKKPDDLTDDDAPGSRSWYARAYMLWLTFPPMTMLFLDQPFFLVLLYGTLGALFMPFLAVTLLFLLNHERVPAQWRNRMPANIVLAVATLVFVALGVNELVKQLT